MNAPAPRIWQSRAFVERFDLLAGLGVAERAPALCVVAPAPPSAGQVVRKLARYDLGHNAHDPPVVEQIAARFPAIDVAILFGGAARTLCSATRTSSSTPPMVQATRILGAPTVVPVHVDSRTHFTEDITDVRAAFTTAGVADLLQVPNRPQGL